MKKFDSIAFYEASGIDLKAAQDALANMADQLTGTPARAELVGAKVDDFQVVLSFEECTSQMSVRGGKSTGRINVGNGMLLVLVLLLGFRKVLLSLKPDCAFDIVDDNSKAIPLPIRQRDGLFAPAWPSVEPIAHMLGLAPNPLMAKKFRERFPFAV